VTLRLSEAARDDLRAIYRYYAERSPASADRVVGTILKAANGLTRFPLMGKQGAIEGTRERVVTRYPYRIVYGIEEDAIIVLRIVHGAQQWP
jgi:addiction module RelE/StbE family toxin